MDHYSRLFPNPLAPTLRGRRSLTYLLLAGLLSSAGAAGAQPTITGTSPLSNARAASVSGPVSVTFNQALTAGSAAALQVFSAQRGGLRSTGSGSTTVSGSTVSFAPSYAFKPGETVQATITTAATAAAGGSLATPQVLQFTTAAGVGPGLFSGGSDPSVGNTPVSVAVGDVDGDGDLDVLTANVGANTVSVRLNNGSGTFSGGSDPAVGNTSASVAVGDVDGDGDLDLLTTSSTSNTVSVRLNNGSGTFSGGSDPSVGAYPLQVTVGDVDGDGDLDLLTANGNGDNVSVRLNNGSGTFSGGSNVAVGDLPSGIAVGDVDGDGDLDLLTTNQNSDNVSVRLNDGSGTFSGGADLTASNPTSVAVGDVDGDGDLDLLVANSAAGTVSVWLNNGSGTFSVGSSPVVGITPYRLTVGDVDGDGDLDLLATDDVTHTVRVRLNNGSGTFSGGSNPSVGNGVNSVAVGDVDGDGDLDLLTANSTDNTVSVRFNEVPDLIVTTTLTVPGGTYNNVTVTATGSLTLTGALTANTTITVQTGGTLTTNCQPITGAASFSLQTGATLRICDPAGITTSGATGAIQVTGARSFAADATYVYNGTSAQVTGNALPAPVRELEAANPTTLTLSQAASVTTALRLTSGTLTTGGLALTLLSSATRTAYAVHVGGLTSGNVTVQRFVGGPTTVVGYRHLSSPVAAAPVSDLTTTGFTAKVNAAYNAIPTPSMSAAAFPNVFGYDETRGGATNTTFTLGYYSPAALSSILTPGRGFTVYLRGGLTPDFVGALTTGSLTVSGLTRTGTNTNPAPAAQKPGWHLLGNPYPQPISWDLFSVPTDLDAAVFVWYSTDGTSGAYRTRAAGVGNLTDGLIGVGQAFFTRVSGTGPVNFTFTNALRVEENVGLGRSAPATRPVLRLSLAAAGAAAGQGDETFVTLAAGATGGVDAAFDAVRPGRNVGLPTLATLIDGQEAAINALPAAGLGATTTVELTAVLPTAGAYSLAVGELVNFAGTRVELLDRLTGTHYELHPGFALPLTGRQANEEVVGRFALVLTGQRVLATSAPQVLAAPLTLSPNPASAEAGVRVSGCGAGTTVTVFDVAGRQVGTAVGDAVGEAQVALRGLAPGVYTVRTADARTIRLLLQ